MKTPRDVSGAELAKALRKFDKRRGYYETVL